MTQKYVKLDGTESDQHWETFHCKSVFSMQFKDMDPSCALGFLIRDSEELNSFVEFLEKTGISDNKGDSVTNSLFSIVTERPVYDQSLLVNCSSNNEEDNEFEMM